MSVKPAIVPLIILSALLAGCGSPPGSNDDRAVETLPSTLTPPPPEKIEGHATYAWAVRRGNSTETLLVDGENIFTLAHDHQSITVTLSWGNTTPGSEIEAALGFEDGSIVNRTAGSSPLLMTVTPAKSGDYRFLLRSRDEIGVVTPQTFDWTATTSD